MEIDFDGKVICQYNRACSCDVPDCDNCGWNPVVSERRLNKIRRKLGVKENKYTIPFTGYCEVWAVSEEDAIEKADDGDMFFVEYKFSDPVCNDEEDENE